jgi:uncharacterized membrane protein YfhO
LFVKDAYCRYWSAKVNGVPVPICRALGNFKALPVPAGPSEVWLRFAPPWVGWAVLLRYAAILGLALGSLWHCWRRAPASATP